MVDCQETERHPTKILAESVTKFAEDIDSLCTTLPLLMAVMTTVVKKSEEDFQTFINESASNKTENDHHITYTIKVEDITRHNRLKRNRNSALTSVKFIPRHYITSLVSQYDSFLGCIVRFIFDANSEILDASEKSIPFTELQKFDTIRAASDYIIEKEVEAVIRKSVVEQFKWLKEKLKIPFTKNLKSWPVFVELNERRNLFVHCDGYASSQYIKCCSEHKCKLDSTLKIGDQLGVDPDYFREAYKCVYEIGVKAAHVVWRKLCSTYIEDSDDNIINLTFDLIQNKQYDLAIRLLDFFTGPTFKHSSETNKLIMIVNLAQAYKWDGDGKSCKKVIDQIDWSASEDRFKLAVAVLRDDYDQTYDLMKRLRHDEYFHKSYYRNWPLFKQLRKEEKFPDVFEECYGEPFNIQKETQENVKLSGKPADVSDQHETLPAFQ